MEVPKKTGRFGKGNPGKPKGALSHTTRTAKEAIALAAEGLGGSDRMIAWAKEDPLNERAFWSNIYPKLLPLQLTGDAKNPLFVVGVTQEQRDAAVHAAQRADA